MVKFNLHIKLPDKDVLLAKDSMQVVQVWGEIYVELNNSYFPSEDWYDITSSILDMWIPSVIDFVCKNKDHCELYFMDGPHKVCLSWFSPQEIKISTFRDNREEITDICYVSEFLESFVCALDSFINQCNDANINLVSGRVLPRIVATTKELKNIAESLKHKTSDDSQ